MAFTPVLQSDTFEIQRQKINQLGIPAGPQFLSAPIYIIKIEQSEIIGGDGGTYQMKWFPTAGAPIAVPDASVTVASTKTAATTNGTWQTFTIPSTAGIPSTVSSLIIEASSNTNWGDSSPTSPFYIFVRQNSSATNSYPILRTGIGYTGNAGQVAHSQGTYPIGSNLTFDWVPLYGNDGDAGWPNYGIYARIIGYYN
jgi:hypothetical protein